MIKDILQFDSNSQSSIFTKAKRTKNENLTMAWDINLTVCYVCEKGTHFDVKKVAE